MRATDEIHFFYSIRHVHLFRHVYLSKMIFVSHRSYSNRCPTVLLKCRRLENTTVQVLSILFFYLLFTPPSFPLSSLHSLLPSGLTSFLHSCLPVFLPSFLLSFLSGRLSIFLSFSLFLDLSLCLPLFLSPSLSLSLFLSLSLSFFLIFYFQSCSFSPDFSLRSSTLTLSTPIYITHCISQFLSFPPSVVL